MTKDTLPIMKHAQEAAKMANREQIDTLLLEERQAGIKEGLERAYELIIEAYEEDDLGQLPALQTIREEIGKLTPNGE